ncbi:hypothetical protein [Brevundimonas sp. TWP2-3-4b1]
MTLPSLEDVEAMELEEMKAAIDQLRRHDPVAFLEAIAAIVGDYD